MAYRTVTFSVKAVGEGLTYQWYVRYGDSSTATTITADTHLFYDDIVEYSGYNTPYLTVWIPTECDVKLTFFCLVQNKNGRMTSKTATLTTEHCFPDRLYPIDKRSFAIRCLIDGEVQTIEGWISNYHQNYCIGEGCRLLSEEIKHNYGGWEPGALPTKDYEGYKTRGCLLREPIRPAQRRGVSITTNAPCAVRSRLTVKTSSSTPQDSPSVRVTIGASGKP